MAEASRRKISSGVDRKRLKSIMADLKLPSTMGLIVRTAGLSRTKVEIKRDFDYLARLWDEIRERTLGSTAPALIYRDSDLVKRAIRDLYHREIDEVFVEGEEGYKAARGFMKLLMPSHVRRVKLHSESTPLFQRYGAEDQLSAMYQPIVQLKSGGYLVINPTEALVSIDINSGRSTREHNIEQTAFATNLEAAAEIARQLRLRDMAGLIVIDFIDMEQSSHVRKVEKAMKDALKSDRARIQVGRIFELRTDGNEPPAAEDRRARSVDQAMRALRRHRADAHGGVGRAVGAAHDRGRSDPRTRRKNRPQGRPRSGGLRPQQKAFRARRYRAALRRLDRDHDRRELRRRPNDGRKFGAATDRDAPRRALDHRHFESDDDSAEEAEEAEVPEEAGDQDEDEHDTVEISLEGEAAGEDRASDEERPGRRRRRRRRGGRGRGRRDDEGQRESGEPIAAEEHAAQVPQAEETAEETRAEPTRRRRRRGRQEAEQELAATPIEPDSSPMVERPLEDEPPIAETAPADQPKPRARRRKAAAPAPEIAVPELAPADAPPAETIDDATPPAKPTRKRRTKAPAEPKLRKPSPSPCPPPIMTRRRPSRPAKPVEAGGKRPSASRIGAAARLLFIARSAVKMVSPRR